MDNVIEQDKMGRHTIQRYRFKVLGSVKSEEEREEYGKQNVETSDFQPEKSSNTNDIVKNDSADINQNKFIEELLKKSDTLSTNIIKLQIQIEKQESEFEARLKESVAREKEIAYNEGYAKAKAELEEKYNEKMANYIESAKKFKEKMDSIDGYFAKIEKNLLDTSLEVAREVIKKEISNVSSQVALSLSKALVEDLKDAVKITIKTNPKDYDTLKEVFAQDVRVEVHTDSAISPGGVILLSERGNLDGSISARLEKVKYLLQNSSED